MLWIMLLQCLEFVAILTTRETREPGGLPSLIGGANPPDERKGGVANVCYLL